jgi:prephenate dehydratase
MKENIRVAIQGVKGSFHHAVAQSYYGEGLTLVECETFDATVNTLLEDKANQAVMAIENSIAGSIIPNYALIDQNELQIVGEYALSIHHNLMALPGQTLADLLWLYCSVKIFLRITPIFVWWKQKILLMKPDEFLRIKFQVLPRLQVLPQQIYTT